MGEFWTCTLYAAKSFVEALEVAELLVSFITFRGVEQVKGSYHYVFFSDCSLYEVDTLSLTRCLFQINSVWSILNTETLIITPELLSCNIPVIICQITFFRNIFFLDYLPRGNAGEKFFFNFFVTSHMIMPTSSFTLSRFFAQFNSSIPAETWENLAVLYCF